MKTCFVTSGFTDGFPDTFIYELRKHLSSQNRFTFVASDFAAQHITLKYMDIVLGWFSAHGIAFKEAGVVDHGVTKEQAAEMILTADVVWLSGGPTLAQIASIKDYDLIPALQASNGIAIGMSAGSINMAKRVVLARDVNDDVPELSIYVGIGLVNFNIEPHLQAASDAHLTDVEEASKVSPIIGLPDNSFIIDNDGTYSIFGPYRLFNAQEI